MTSPTRRLAALAALPVCMLLAIAPARAQAWDHGDGGRGDYGHGWRSGGDEERGRWNGYRARAAYEPGYGRGYGYRYGYEGVSPYGGWRRPVYAPVAIVEPPPVVPVVVEQPPVVYEAPEPAPVAYEVPPPPVVIVHHHVHHAAVRHCGCTCAPVR